MSKPLEMRDFLDATSSASHRSRAVLVTLVLACVLILAGSMGSWHSSWMHLRVLDEGYVASKLGGVPQRCDDADSTDYYRHVWGVSTYGEVLDTFRERRIAFYRALSSAYVQDELLVRVPFFGYSLDVNDLGVVGGVALFIIIGIHGFALSREFDNLRIAFAEAELQGCENLFYRLLSMHQVFTIPMSQFVHKRVLGLAPKVILVLPVLVQLAVYVHDQNSYHVGASLHPKRAWWTLRLEEVLLALILVATVVNLVRVWRIDRFWDQRWQRQLEQSLHDASSARQG